MKKNWEYKKLGEVCNINFGTRVVQKKDGGSIYDVYGGGGATFKIDRYNREDCFIVSRFAMSPKCTRFVSGKFFLNDSGLSVSTNNEKLSQQFVDAFLLSSNDKIYSLGKGAAQRNLDMESFRQLIIPVPSRDVQERIVAELDLLNGVLEKQKAQLKELDTLAQSIFYDMFGDPIENSKGWDVIKLENACVKLTDGTHNSPVNTPQGDFPYITAKNIRKTGLDLSDLTYVSEAVHRDIFSRCNPEYGDVLYIKDGITTGIAQVNTLTFEFSLLSSVALLKPKKDIVNSHFITGFLNNDAVYKKARSSMGGAAITRLTLSKLKKFDIILPPLPLQQAFAEKIASIESQKATINQSIAETQKLLDYTMDKYFG